MAVSDRLLTRGLAMLLAVALLLAAIQPAQAQMAGDPIERLRQTLNATNNLDDRDEQTKACLAELHNLGDLRKAAMLREWRHHNANAELAALDQANRNALAGRFRGEIQHILTGNEVGTILAVLDMLSETAASQRTIGEPPVLTRPLTADVAKLVGGGDPAVRIAAARALGRIDPDLSIALPVLIGLAKAPEPARRIDAAAALGEVLQAIAQPWTSKQFNPQILPDRHGAAESAAQLLPLAGACVLDPNREVQRHSLTTLALAATLLAELTPPVRTEARDPAELRALAQALAAQLKSVLRRLRDPDGEMKLLALKVLEETAHARRHWLEQVSVSTMPGEKSDDPLAQGLAAALPAMAETLGDDDLRVRRATLDVLENYGPLASAAAPAVTLALKDPDRYVRWSAVRTLGAIGTAARPAIPALAKLLQDPDLDLRQAAVGVLQVLDPSGQGPPKKPGQSAIPALIHSLNNDPVEMRLTALHSLASMGGNSKEAIAALAAAVSDPDPRVRLAAVQALGAMGPPAKPVRLTLRKALKDSDPAVIKAAGEALMLLDREP